MANYVKHPTLKAGDLVRCLKPVSFVDGTNHYMNDILVVEEDTLSYYRLHTPGRYEVWA